MEILYSDNDIAVCVKPIGLDSEHEVPEVLSQQLGGVFYTLHRLDKNVSGVMVYARSKAAAAEISRSITRGDMIKEYVALVHGAPPTEGTWEDLLFKDSRKNKVFVVNRQRSGVKAARLTYRCLKTGAESLVRIRLYTGRSHQIRVQFASRGYPLVGDHKYGSRDDATAPMLFSCCIRFPFKGKNLQFEAAPQWAETDLV